MKKFKAIRQAAEKRKGGATQVAKLLTPPKTVKQLIEISDDRYLAQMTRCVFNAGFHWRVITNKWPDFELAFHGFDLGALLTKSPEEWEAYIEDKRIVRNWQKIQTVFQNAVMMENIIEEYGSFGQFFTQWPVNDQIGLMQYFKKNGARLGGQTGQYFIRFIGKDSFITSDDVCTALIANGVDINNKPTSQRDLKKVQEAFNEWQQQSGLPISHISKILSLTVGDDIEVDQLVAYTNRQSVS